MRTLSFLSHEENLHGELSGRSRVAAPPLSLTWLSEALGDILLYQYTIGAILQTLNTPHESGIVLLDISVLLE